MQLIIENVLDARQLQLARELLQRAPFQDGKLTAGDWAARVKHNEEVPTDAVLVQQINNLVMTPLVRHPRFQAAVLPQRIAAPIYARYRPGMEYGFHVDDPIMGAAQGKYRTDVSFTLFLSSPEEYQGGELEIAGEFGTLCHKLPAGHAIVYPSSSLHRVKPVREGTRLVAISWIQSLIRSPACRQVLYDMNLAREKLAALQARDEAARLDTAYANLFRMWAEP